MGAIVAMTVAKLAQERIYHLVLMATNPFQEKTVVKVYRKLIINDLENGNLSAVMNKPYISKYFFENSKNQMSKKICFDMVMHLGPKTFIRQSTALMKRASQIETLKALKSKTLILCGRQDPLCPLAYHERINNLVKDSKLVVLERTGHLPTLENPVLTNHHLHKFVY